MTATRTLWRWMRHPDGTSYVETTRAGERCDWAKGGAYEQLGWAVEL